MAPLTDQQKAERAFSLGASEFAAAVGLNPFCDPTTMGQVMWHCATECGSTMCAASAESMEAARLAYDGACARMDRAERARWKAQARGWRAIVAPILRDVFAMTEKENA